MEVLVEGESAFIRDAALANYAARGNHFELQLEEMMTASGGRYSRQLFPPPEDLLPGAVAVVVCFLVFRTALQKL